MNGYAENLLLSFNVVAPLFLCILLGVFLRRIGLLKKDTLGAVNSLCFRVFLPIYLFNNIYGTTLAEAFDAKLVVFSVITVLCVFLAAMLLIPRVERDNANRGAMIQAIFRSNFALFGLPVAISLCGEDRVGPTSLLVGILVPVYNVLAVITLEFFRGGKPDPLKMVRGILTNPLIVASVLGIVMNLLSVPLPEAVMKASTDLGRVATPLSLVALGGSFVLGSVRVFRKQITLSVTAKLILFPLAATGIAVLLGFRDEMLAPVLIFSGAPTAVSSFPMAQQMGSNGELAADLVVFTTGFCILTMFVFIFIGKQLALL
ncbi:MAG: AEC family transporter [Lachnospiraceae bacterium]|nr:AEC family transporter [Lachnospiraceae bacterium]